MITSVPNELGRTPSFALDSGMARVDIDLGLYRAVATTGCVVFDDSYEAPNLLKCLFSTHSAFFRAAMATEFAAQVT